MTTDKVKSQFNQNGRRLTGMSGGRSGSMENANGGGEDESSPLISGNTRIGETPQLLRTRMKNMREDDRAWVRYPMKFLYTTWAVLASNYVNVLLVFVPVGIVLGALDIDPVAIFIVNFIAIIPLAALLSFATEELSVKLGQTIGGLMNATFGNAVELIVGTRTPRGAPPFHYCGS